MSKIKGFCYRCKNRIKKYQGIFNVLEPYTEKQTDQFVSTLVKEVKLVATNFAASWPQDQLVPSENQSEEAYSSDGDKRNKDEGLVQTQVIRKPIAVQAVQ